VFGKKKISLFQERRGGKRRGRIPSKNTCAHPMGQKKEKRGREETLNIRASARNGRSFGIVCKRKKKKRGGKVH